MNDSINSKTFGKSLGWDGVGCRASILLISALGVGWLLPVTFLIPLFMACRNKSPSMYRTPIKYIAIL